VLRKYLRNAIGGVHILPFYPSSADRGFAPLTYDEVDPAFGTWEDVEHIGRDFDLIVDFMVNHISRQSVYFQDYMENGEESPYADMFLSFRKLSPDGELPDADLSKVYTRKPRPPYTVIHRPDGSREKIWCTFDYEQIDLDYRSPVTRAVVRQFLIRLARSRPKMIRLDAFAYTTFKLGTNCFFLEPEVWELLEWFSGFTAPFDVEVLPEVHDHHRFVIAAGEPAGHGRNADPHVASSSSSIPMASLPRRNRPLFIRRRWSPAVVAMPRTEVSISARAIRPMARDRSGAQAIIFAISGS